MDPNKYYLDAEKSREKILELVFLNSKKADLVIDKLEKIEKLLSDKVSKDGSQ